MVDGGWWMVGGGWWVVSDFGVKRNEFMSGSKAKLLLAGGFVILCAAARAEAVAPDEPEPRTPAQTNTTTSGDVRATTVDEPDFKAKVILPDKPSKALLPGKHEWTMPPEEDADSGAAVAGRSAPSAEANSKEEISAALAKAIGKERETKQAKDMAPLYQAVVEAEPENAAAHYRLGLAQARSGEFAKGLVELEKAAALQPANPKYQCDYGLAALRNGLLDKALRACRAAAAAAPSSGRYQSALGDCFLAAGSLGNAAEAYKRAIHAAPDNAEYIHNLGVAHLHAGAYKQAIEILSEAIRLRPSQARYYCSRGLAEMSLNQMREAIRDYTTALARDKDDAYAHFLLASAYSDPNDPTYTSSFEAVEHAEKAVKLTEYRNARYLMGLARALRAARQYDKAVETAQKAVALDPRPDYRKELAEFQQLQGK